MSAHFLPAILASLSELVIILNTYPVGALALIALLLALVLLERERRAPQRRRRPREARCAAP